VDLLAITGITSLLNEGSERSEGSEGYLEGYPFKPEEVLKLERLTTNIQDKCCVCGLQGRMDYQVTLHNGSWGLLCGDCGFKFEKKLGTGGWS